MPDLDKALINMLLTVAHLKKRVGVFALLKEMQEATENGIDFEFDLYKLEQKANPINFDNQPWNQDIMYMTAYFRVTPSSSDGSDKPKLASGIFFEEDVIDAEIVDEPPKELPSG